MNNEHLTLQVERLLEVGRAHDAQRLLTPHLQENPTDFDALVLASRAFHALGDHTQARALLDTALSQSPHDVEARLHLFHLQEDGQEYAAAEETILALLRDLPENGHLYALYSGLMFDTLHLEKARQLVNEAQRLNPSSSYARVLDISLSLIEGRGQSSTAALAELVCENPDSAPVLYIAVDILLKRHRDRQALELAQMLVRLNPAHKETLELYVNLRVRTHPLMWPLGPMKRWGWAASVVLWGIMMFSLQIARRFLSPAAAGVVALFFITYIAYSWLAPPLIRRWVLWRGTS